MQNYEKINNRWSGDLILKLISSSIAQNCLPNIHAKMKKIMKLVRIIYDGKNSGTTALKNFEEKIGSILVSDLRK